MKLHRSISAMAVGASLIGGTVLGATAFGPFLAGAESAEGATTESVAFAAEGAEPVRDRMNTVLGGLVTDGTLTQAQLDAVVDTLIESGPLGHRGERQERRGERHEAVAAALGIDVATLEERIRGGETVAEIAAAEGLDINTVIAELVAAAEARIDQAVTDGELTAEEAAERKADLTERITARVNGERPEGEGPGGRGGPGGPGGRGGFGQGAPSAEGGA